MQEHGRGKNQALPRGRGDAVQRLAAFLLELRSRARRVSLLSSTSSRFALEMSQKQIGDHLALTSLEVNRMIRLLREGGIATVSKRSVTIHNAGALKQLAEPRLARARVSGAGLSG